MRKEDSAGNENDLEILEIAEFKRSDTRKEIHRYEEQEKQKRRKCYGILILFAAGFLAAILLGILVFQLSVVLVCVILVLETVIAACLHNEPVWIHGLEMLVSVGAGVLYGEPLFLLVAALVYLGAILVLYYMKQLEL